MLLWFLCPYLEGGLDILGRRRQPGRSRDQGSCQTQGIIIVTIATLKFTLNNRFIIVFTFSGLTDITEESVKERTSSSTAGLPLRWSSAWAGWRVITHSPIILILEKHDCRHNDHQPAWDGWQVIRVCFYAQWRKVNQWHNLDSSKAGSPAWVVVVGLLHTAYTKESIVSALWLVTSS